MDKVHCELGPGQLVQREAETLEPTELQLLVLAVAALLVTGGRFSKPAAEWY
ncbi:hypothetical protein ACFY8W_20625 [Streptomyces sp. NPDC012637]|uniref:hypothetical protein n=1 Tax=Streptomyces sp. NPDC012637 TaxID=3364842 RepID=UPI0036E8E07D